MEMNFIIQESKDPNLFKIKLGTWLITGTISCSQILILFELVCYVKIFKEIYKNDRRLGTNALGKETMRARKKKNAITLYGQVINFIIEIGSAIILVVLLQFHNHFDESIATFLLITNSAILSFTNICTSAELRRHYFSGYFSF